jgi:5-methylcytosine-specific restriction endonuclease McrBC regulatory subunit McrC
MNAVYEDFITDLAEDVITSYPEFSAYKLEKQSQFDSLVKEKRIVTKPDIILSDGKDKYPFIIDAKYKRDAANADYYQVVAYSLALKSTKCYLIYPDSEKEIDMTPLTLVHNPSKDEPEKTTLILTRKIDLHIDEEMEYENYISEIKRQLKIIFLDIINH